MKTSITVLILFFCVQTGFVNAQQNPSKEKTDELIALCKEVEGTYKVIQYNPRVEVVLTSDVCEVVKKNRKKSETVYYKYNEFITLEIYSEEQVKKLKPTSIN